MTSNSDISSDYLDDSDTGTSAAKPRSQLREFLRNPVPEQEMKHYGTSKPQRKIVRAKLIHGKDQ